MPGCVTRGERQNEAKNVAFSVKKDDGKAILIRIYRRPPSSFPRNRKVLCPHCYTFKAVDVTKPDRSLFSCPNAILLLYRKRKYLCELASRPIKHKPIFDSLQLPGIACSACCCSTEEQAINMIITIRN